MGGSDSAFDYQGAELLAGATAVFKSKGVAIAALHDLDPAQNPCNGK